MAVDKRHRRFIRALVVTCAITPWITLASPASAEEAGIATIPHDVVRLAVDQPGSLVVVNGFSTDVVVQVTPTARDTDGAPVEVDVGGVEGVLRPGGSLAVELTLPAGVGAEIEGFALVTATRVDNQEATSLRVKLASPAAPLPVPAVTSWETIGGVWRHTDSPSIPLKGSCPVGEAAWTKDINLVAPGAHLTATFHCVENGLTMAYPQGQKPGLYKGELAVGTEKIAISFTQTRPVWIALLLVLLGAAVSMWATAQVTVVRPLKRLLHDKQAGASAPLPGGFTELGTPKLDDRLTRYRARWWRTYLDKDVGDAVKEAETEVKALTTAREEAAKLPEALSDLREELDSALPDSQATAMWEAAAQIDSTSRTFNGSETISEIRTFTSALRTLDNVHGYRNTLSAMYRLLPDQSATDLAMATSHRLELLDQRLRTSTTGKQLTAINADDEERQVDAAIRALRGTCRAGFAGDQHITPPGQPGGAMLPASVITPWPEVIRRIQRFAARTWDRAPNWVLFVIAFTAAILAAHAAFYEGEPWGTPLDIVAAFSYGATTFVAAFTLSTYFGDLGKEVKTAPAGAARQP